VSEWRTSNCPTDPDVALLHARILRRIAVKTSGVAISSRPPLIAHLSRSLQLILSRDVQPDAVAAVHDACLRCVQLGGDQALFEPMVALALAAGSAEVRGLVLRALHAPVA
jgi:hypothetical protein